MICCCKCRNPEPHGQPSDDIPAAPYARLAMLFSQVILLPAQAFRLRCHTLSHCSGAEVAASLHSSPVQLLGRFNLVASSTSFVPPYKWA